MKILMVFHTLTYPAESGVTKRNLHLLDQTARRHDTTVVAFGSPRDEEGIRRHLGDRCRKIVFADGRRPRWRNLLKRIELILTRRSLLQLSINAPLRRAIDEALRAERFDAVFLSTPLLHYYRSSWDAPCITDNHNVEYDMCRRTWEQAKGALARAYHHDQYRMLKRDELAMCARADVLLTTSERDRDVFRRDLTDPPIHVVPNGVDLGHFAPAAEPPEPLAMVFSGLMNYPPNAEGILWFLDEVLPLVHAQVPEARLTVVGSGPSRAILGRASERVTVTGYVTDVRPYVAKGQVYVVPLLVGGGTRLKALEAMAMGKAIVTTSVGCEGIDLRQGESALFADAPQAFADAVVRLFRDAELRERLGREALALARARYGWDAIGEKLEGIYRAAAAQRDGASRRDFPRSA